MGPNGLRPTEELEQTITLGEWKKCREAEYQRLQDKKKEQTKGEHQ